MKEVGVEIGNLSLALSVDIQVSCSSLSYQISRWACVVLCPTPCKQDRTGQGLPGYPGHIHRRYTVSLLGLGRVFQRLCSWFCSSHISGACECLAPVHRSEALSRLAVGLVSLTCGCLLLLVDGFLPLALFPGSQTKDHTLSFLRVAVGRLWE